MFNGGSWCYDDWKDGVPTLGPIGGRIMVEIDKENPRRCVFVCFFQLNEQVCCLVLNYPSLWWLQHKLIKQRGVSVS